MFLGDFAKVCLSKVRFDFVDIMKSELNVDLTCVKGMELESVGVDIPTVLDLVAVWFEVFEIFAIVVKPVRHLE